MDISSIASAGSVAMPPPALGTASPTSDFDTFLKLLTAQIRNQDPLEPADSTAYTAQLATFSNVEQAVKTNDLLAQMISRLDGQQIGGASAYLGMEVRHSGPLAHTGGSTIVHTNINPTADRAELVVRDARGAEVARHPIDPDGQTVGWPANGSGGSVANGTYRLDVESWAGERKLDPTRVDHYAKVAEVVFASGGSELILEGGVRLPADGLQSIRAPRS